MAQCGGQSTVLASFLMSIPPLFEVASFIGLEPHIGQAICPQASGIHLSLSPLLLALGLQDRVATPSSLCGGWGYLLLFLA